MFLCSLGYPQPCDTVVSKLCVCIHHILVFKAAEYLGLPKHGKARRLVLSCSWCSVVVLQGMQSCWIAGGSWDGSVVGSRGGCGALVMEKDSGGICVGYHEKFLP